MTIGMMHIMDNSISNREIFSVADLTKSARRLLEGEFPNVFVEGEISNFSVPASGHWYFTLKDQKAQLKCAMFKGRNRLIRFVPRNGMQIILRGKVSLYEGRGDFQMIGEFMEEAGDGALRHAFEKLKLQLAAEGLFEPEAKKPIPAMIQHLGVITSPTGAAVRDVLHVLKRRFPAMEVTIIPTAVQGEDSVRQIVESLAFANDWGAERFDALLLTRGGGSLEDLWSFNTEPVARAIFDSELPIVAAVGHETDVTIADFVADLRAPTPSAAAEVISPDIDVWESRLSSLEAQLIRIGQQTQAGLAQRITHLQKRLRHPGQRLQDWHQRLDDLEARITSGLRQKFAGQSFNETALRLTTAMEQTLSKHQTRLAVATSQLRNPLTDIELQHSQVSSLEQRLHTQRLSFLKNATQGFDNVTNRLEAVSPLKTLQRGYAMVLTKDEAGNRTILKDTASIKEGDVLDTQLGQGSFRSTVTSTSVESIVEDIIPTNADDSYDNYDNSDNNDNRGHSPS